MKIVVRARLLPVDVHQVVLGSGGIARVERGERAVLVLEHEARHVRVVARKHQPYELAAHRLYRPEQVLEDVCVVNADLQHDSSGHALGAVAPGREIDLAQAIAADVRLGIDQLAEYPFIYFLFNKAKMCVAAGLVSEREHGPGFTAGLGDGARLGDGVGDRLVEKDMLAGRRRGAGGLEVRGVRRGIDDRLYCPVGKNLLIGSGAAAAVFGCEPVLLFAGTREARGNRQFAGSLDRVRQYVRPPAHAETGDPHCELHSALAPIEATASRASFSSNSQLPPATPMPPRHSPSTRIGQPPSIAVQRPAPAASARPRAWATSSGWPCAPCDEVRRLLEAAHTAFPVAE